MTAFKQDIRFARTQDGVRIAYAVSGRGYPLVRATHWLTNVELDFRTPIYGPLIEAFSARYRLYRYNARGYGLSEGAGMALSLETHLHDLEAAIDAAGHEQFALYGSSGGGPVCIAYAARHPERVSHLVLVNTFARGILRRNPTPEQEERFFAMLRLVELGWGKRIQRSGKCLRRSSFPAQHSSSSAQRMSCSDCLLQDRKPRATFFPTASWMCPVY
jgi:pimeloyl-ACP methyl ester carboxylesterase